MELKINSSVLIDKVVIFNVPVVEIAVDKVARLLKERILTLRQGVKWHLETTNSVQYDSICIKKKMRIGLHTIEDIYGDLPFDRFTVSIGCYKEYQRLEISVSRPEYHNLYCMTCIELRERLYQIADFLLAVGIKISLDNAKFKSLEINKTVQIDKEFYYYRRPLTLVMYLLPDYLRLGDMSLYYRKPERKRNGREMVPQYENYLCGIHRASKKKHLEVKVYDKTYQLLNVYHIYVRQNYLRFEITLGSPTKISNILGTNCVYGITDERINIYFSKFIKDNIKKPYTDTHPKKYQAQKNILLKRIFSQNHEKYSKSMAYNMDKDMNNYEIKRNIPLILDISEFISILDNIRPKLSSKEKYRIKKSIEAKCSEVYKQGDLEKLFEVFDKLLMP